MLQVSEHFASQCSPVIGLADDTCGSVTRADIAFLTPSQLNDLFSPGGLFADMDGWFLHQIEMNACGVKRYAFYDWIMANADRTVFRAAVDPGMKVVGGAPMMRPFILAKQEDVINQDYWKVVGGAATGSYTINHPEAAVGTTTQGPLTTVTGGTRVIRVNNRHNIPLDPNWFRQRDVLYLFNKAGNGVTTQGNWRVIAAAVDDALTYIDVLVASENAGSNAPFDATPIKGVIIPGINNVNDYEKFCQNLPNILNQKRVPFWLQTSRWSRCIDSEYEVVYGKLISSNAAFREFYAIDEAKRNKQDETKRMRDEINAFLFQKAISANQTMALWENLEAINTVAGDVIDVNTSGKLIARRANFIGVKEQLRVCDRVIDLQNNPLNLLEFLDLNYDIARYRKTAGRKVTDIDWWMNTTMRSYFHTAMMQYYKDMYLDQARFIVEINKMSEELGVVYDSYMVKRPGGIRINIISDDFFDDYFDEFDAQSMGHVGNLILNLDIGKPPNGSIYLAQIASNRRAYTTAQIQELAKIDKTYLCVMENPTFRQTLTSETRTVVVECGKLSAWLDGAALTIPVTSSKSAPYSNLY